MKTIRRLTEAIFLSCCILAFSSGTAQSDSGASSYPHRPVRLLVGFSPGGANDIVARVLAEELTNGFGQQFIVDNRPGANGRIANSIEAGASPDGQTILLVPTSFALDAARGARLPYSADKDFSPVVLLASAPFVLVVSPNLPLKSTEDLIRLARSQPGKLNAAHTGVGNLTQVLAEMFKSLAKLDIVSVPYKGGGPALVDVATGQVQMIFTGMPPALPFIRSGRVKLLAVTSSDRSQLMPDVPTISESGVPGYEAYGWWGMLARAGTPGGIIARLNDESNKALRTESVKNRLSGLGATALGGSPGKFADFIRAEIRTWTAVMKNAGIADH